MGRLKANLPLGAGHTFLTRIVTTFLAAGVDDVVVVVGHEADAVVAEFVKSGLPARFVENRAYENGQLSSLLAGLGVVDRPGVPATLVTLVDVPLVSTATVRAVLRRYEQTRAPIVRPTRGDEHGHPLLVDRSLFNELRQADPLEGAKPIVRAHVTPDSNVEVDNPGAFADIDTPEDYERAMTALRRDAR